jgi:putative endonuclease
MRDHRYYVYILTNRSRTLYTGVTSDLERRMQEHKQNVVPGFTAQYNIDQLVFYEEFANINEAIAMEKRLKGWTRAKKIALIEIAQSALGGSKSRLVSSLAGTRVDCHAERTREASGPDVRGLILATSRLRGIPVPLRMTLV